MTESVGFDRIKQVYFGGLSTGGKLRPFARFGGISPALGYVKYTTTDTVVKQRVIGQGDGYEKNYFGQLACLAFVTASRMPDGGSKQQ